MVKASLKRRLDALAAGPRLQDRSGGVLVMPPIAPLDAWGRRAVAQQAALVADALEDRGDGPRVSAVSSKLP